MAGLHATSQTAMAHCETVAEGWCRHPGHRWQSPPALARLQSARGRAGAAFCRLIRHAVTLGVPVSVDTYKPAVMQAALDLGADIINDVWALALGGRCAGRAGEDVIAAHRIAACA